MYTRAVRDPIHGFVELTSQEWEAVNSAAFQRLRDIRQLGMGHFVYPGANHTRFEHSIGVVEVSTRMLRSIAQRTDPEEWRAIFQRENGPENRAELVLRFASLLHDIGHGPFSHSGEDLFIPVGHDADDIDPAELAKLRTKFNHEAMSARIIRTTDISTSIKSAGIDPEEVVFVATGKDFSEITEPRQDLELLHTLLAGELGSDRCDYLLRDSHHSGQPSGWFDIDRLIIQAAIVTHQGSRRIGLLPGGRIAAEQMVANRYAAYLNLYFHKTKRSLEMHLVEFLKCTLPGGRFPTDLRAYRTVTDSWVMSKLFEIESDTSHPGHIHADAILNRNHFRVAFERFQPDRKNPSIPGAKVQEFQSRVSSHFANSIFIDVMEHSATKMRRRKPEDKIIIDGLKIAGSGDKLPSRSLDDLSEIVGGMNDKIWILRVHSTPDKLGVVSQFCHREWERISDEMESVERRQRERPAP